MGGDTESYPAPAKTRPASRRRFFVAAVAGVALAAAGAWAGNSWTRPRYRSDGMIRVSPPTQRFVYAGDEDPVLPMYDALVESQAELATSRRVVDMAMRSPEWAKLGRGTAESEVAQFVENLAAARRPRSQYLTISFTDEDPTAAKVAVNQVVVAYMKLVGEHRRDSDTALLNQINSRRDVLETQLNNLRESVDAVTDGLGPAGLEAEYREAAGLLAKTNEALVDLDLQVARTTGGVQSDDVRTQRERMQALRAAATQDMRRLTKRRDALDALNAEAATLRSVLGDVKRRLYEIKTESDVRGRITVASTGERPVQSEPGRQRRDAAIGAGAGLVLGVGATLLAGRRRA